MDLLEEQLDPTRRGRVQSLLEGGEVSVPVLLRKTITTCSFPGCFGLPDPPPMDPPVSYF